MSTFNYSDVNDNNYIPTSIDDPTYFSDEGERLDFSRAEPKLNPEAEEVFNRMRDGIVEHETAIADCKKKAVVRCIPFFIIGMMFFFMSPAITVFIVIISYTVIYSKLLKNDKDITSRLVTKMEEKYADLCIEPILSQIEPGVDASYELQYYPVYGYIKKNGYEYYSGCEHFAKWLYNLGILPYFNSHVDVGMSINTLNANREGFFLTNLKVQNSHRSKNRTYYTTEFRGPVIAVRMKNSIEGWFVCHSTSSVGRMENDGKYKSIKDTVDVESEEFNRKFNVTASSQMEAFYVLSPLVIERLLEVRKRVEKIGLYITGDFCIFTLYTNRWYFNPPRSAAEAKNIDFNQYWSDLAGLVNFAYSFKDAVDLNFT